MIKYRDLEAQADRDTCPLPLGGPPGGGRRFWAAISLRRAGDMKRPGGGPSTDRSRLLSSLGIDESRLFCCRQVHSRRVLTVTRRDPAAYGGEEADGLISDLDGVVLAVTVADCLPLLLVDPGRGAFAILHSGWKGTGILQEALLRLRETYGSRGKDLRALIGPGIGSCCYEVDGERYARFREEFGPAAVRRRGSRHILDLRAANLMMLRSAGVEDVTVIRDCTACNPLLSSYRRDGKAGYTHMLAMLGKSDTPENRRTP